MKFGWVKERWEMTKKSHSYGVDNYGYKALVLRVYF